MAVETQNDFIQAARACFPSAAPITGSGRFAVLFRCTERPSVLLFDFASEAQQVAAKECAHAFCKMQHYAVELKPATPVAKKTFRRIYISD